MILETGKRAEAWRAVLAAALLCTSRSAVCRAARAGTLKWFKWAEGRLWRGVSRFGRGKLRRDEFTDGEG